MSKITYTIDVEPDLHSGDFKGIQEGLKSFEILCDKHNIKPILFITGNCIKDNKEIFKRLQKKGWEISSHGFSHKRFDSMPYKEKESEIKKSLEYFRKYINAKPKGFRAPQHSIDSATLDLLESNGFQYDSSLTPLNALQLFFFPKKFRLWLKSFFSPLNPYKIRKNLTEIPPSSLFIPFVSLTIRIFPKILLTVYIKIIKAVYTKPVFYAHSWDLIELKNSKIDKMFSHKKFIEKLNYVMELK